MTWDQFTAHHPAGNILQTCRWGRLKTEFGWSSEVVREQVGGALILYKNLPLKLGKIAYIPRGPVVDWQDTTAVHSVLASVEQAARSNKAWALWVEPEVLRAVSPGELLQLEGYHRWNRTIQPPSTIIVDISVEEAIILGRMKSKTRYNIRLAERKGVQIRHGSLDNLDAFYALMQETGQRDKFGIHSKAYYQRLLEIFSPDGQAKLIFATVDGTPTAAVIIMALGTKAWYIAGASSNKHRNLMPTYAVQWAAMQWAKARGCHTYDLWGVPDADEPTLESEFTQRSDGLWGVYRFKRGFGGDLVRYTGMWQKSLHPFYKVGMRFYQTALNLRSSGGN
ncbi:MAG: peptidoglycan bridge formation glycyltransferase FemA/FemB family protein [Anaerolineae bacterium]|nr:peptidoglycan bridge formation glycyltransferase FemA/FemB family protein [Anaerolineae bacterium]